ncbi:Intron maturase- type II family protein [Striga hermonthica]|uniref:Intron maturase- type II family protein n=1 Tax=Striga hermonthica TaxID=68872 RepID=A0A9N7NDJ7_STRHE|nr:Intron maturase- type II family protein [Striga hermonthica]
MSLRTKIKHLAGIFHTATRNLSYHLSRRHNHPPPKQDPYSLLKEDPIQVLSDLWVKSFSQTQKPFQNLTGFLSKLDLWVLAYQRTCAHATGSFPPRNAIPSHALADLLSLRNAVVSGEFRWDSKAQQFIRSPNDKTPLHLLSRSKLQSMMESGAPLFQDRVVQEVLLMVIEPVFEARFSAKSHAFRPGRNPHTVIRTIRSNFAGYLWFIRGDLSDIVDNLDSNMILDCVEKSVKDKKVLKLIKSGLRRTGKNLNHVEDNGEKMSKNKIKKGQTKKRILLDNEPKPDPYWLRTFFDFAPEEAAKVPDYGYCGILSPLLTNICLNEFDFMMENKIVEFFRPSESDSIWKYSINDGCHNPSWPEFVPTSGSKEKTRKMDYIRFAGHFLIGIRGPREDAVGIRKEIIEFCDKRFVYRLDNSKKGVGTLLSVTASLQQCIRRFRRLSFVKGDKDPEPLPCTPMLYSGQAHTNAQMNKLLETMADWYRYADNRKKIVGFCAYVVRSSLAKLYAARYRLKSRAKVYKIAARDLSHPLRESSNNSAPEYSDLLRMGLVDAIEGVRFSRMSFIPSCDYTPFSRNWVPDHEKLLQEYIKLQDARFFCELSKSVKREGLCLPQENISKIVWDFKNTGYQLIVSAQNLTTRTPYELGVEFICSKSEFFWFMIE